jgi:hypothetical protein
MNKITINEQELQIKEWQGKRVVTFRDIDEVHQRPEGTARKHFNDNKERFIYGDDYCKITASEFRTAIGEMNSRQMNDVILITESGYLMLVKSFTDDLAWQVQRTLVDNYFGNPSDNLAEIPEKSKVHSAQHRFSVPKCDTVFEAWMQAQYNRSSSLRALVHNFVAMHGITDSLLVVAKPSQAVQSALKPESLSPNEAPIAPAAGLSPHDALLHELTKARGIADVTGIPPEVLFMTTIQKMEKTSGEDYSHWKAAVMASIKK